MAEYNEISKEKETARQQREEETIKIKQEIVFKELVNTLTAKRELASENFRLYYIVVRIKVRNF